MSYKGNDLDLRAPDGRPAENGPESGPEPGSDLRLSTLQPFGRQPAIAVDRTVLACCNLAYDIAAFHAAREVGPAHLLHALTRIDAARDILEGHGVRTGELRRDTAVAIVSEPPATPAGTATRPGASTEFEQLLRRSAMRATADGVAASIRDLMRALLGDARETPAAHLLLRAASDPAELERWVAQPAAAFRAEGPAAALQSAAAQALTARLEALETALRTLAAEAAADRQAMLDLLAELQREFRAARTQEAAGSATRLESLAQSVAGLAERFEAIRVFAPGDAGSDMPGRLSALEAKLATQPSAIADAVAFMLDRRRAGAAAEDHAPDQAADRLADLEARLRTQADRMATHMADLLEEAAKAREHDRDELHEALVKLGTNQQTLANNLEAWRLDLSGDVSIVSNRLEALERNFQHASARPARNGARAATFKRWLYQTGRVLPATWRQDAAAIRQSLRAFRRDGKA